MLAVDGGAFVSLLDPPDGAAEAAVACRSDGHLPGPHRRDDVVLSSPIILYDHPEVAPESPGDLYDATEIDEILALRVLTLTDEEKAEARGTDARAAAIIDRCDALSPEAMEPPARADAPGRAGVGRRRPRPGSDAGAVVGPGVRRSVDPWTDSVLRRRASRSRKGGRSGCTRPDGRTPRTCSSTAGTATVAGVFPMSTAASTWR